MGTIKQGILGGFSGKTGTVIGASWKGINYMRGIAASISNPRTAGQLEQRAKFSAVIEFLKPLTSFLRIGFQSQAIKMSAFNAAMSYNLGNAITGIYPAFEIDYTKAVISQGTLPEALNPAVVASATGKIKFTWEDNSTDADAMALLVVYNPVRQKSVSVVAGNIRAGGSQIITVPASFTGDEVQCYISFQNAKGSDVSNSQSVGSLMVL